MNLRLELIKAIPNKNNFCFYLEWLLLVFAYNFEHEEYNKQDSSGIKLEYRVWRKKDNEDS